MGGWLIEVFHIVDRDIQKYRRYPYFTDVRRLESHLKYLMSKPVWVATQGEAAKFFRRILNDA